MSSRALVLSIVTVAGVGLGVIAAGGGHAMVQPSPGGPVINPGEPPFDLAEPERVEAGRQQFKLTCAVAYCHGPEGRIGGGAPSLRGRKVGPPDYIYRTIANGRRRMPAWRSAFPPEKLWTLTAYVMSLEKEPPQ